jgi:hypothetical protein
MATIASSEDLLHVNVRGRRDVRVTENVLRTRELPANQNLVSLSQCSQVKVGLAQIDADRCDLHYDDPPDVNYRAVILLGSPRDQRKAFGVLRGRNPDSTRNPCLWLPDSMSKVARFRQLGVAITRTEVHEYTFRGIVNPSGVGNDTENIVPLAH